MSHGLPTQPAESFKSRRRALAARLGRDQAALLFSGVARPRNYPDNIYPFRPDSHFLYLTGAWIQRAAVLVDGDRDVLFMPPADPDELIWHGAMPGWDAFKAGVGVDEIRDIAELPSVIRERGHATISTLPAVDATTRFGQGQLLERGWAAPGSAPQLDPNDGALADAIIAMRMVHDEPAVEMMRGAAQATVEAHLAGMAATRPGLRESDVRAALERPIHARDMATAYGSIVTVHGEILHSHSYDHELLDGDLLLADVGAENGGWAGDVTRTWPVNGTFSPTQRALYDLVLASQRAAIDMLRPGVRYRDVHVAAGRVIVQGLVDEGVLRGDVDNLIERGAQGLFFVHGLGHIIGLDVHDMEDLGDRAGYAPGRARSDQFGLCFLRLDRDLEAGMAVTIEPGFYQIPALLAPGSKLTAPFDADNSLNREALAKFADVRGIRIEDDVLITGEGSEVLTAALPKDAAAVEALVGTKPA